MRVSLCLSNYLKSNVVFISRAKIYKYDRYYNSLESANMFSSYLFWNEKKKKNRLSQTQKHSWAFVSVEKSELKPNNKNEL